MSETPNLIDTPEVSAFLKLVGQAPAPSDAQDLLVTALTVYVGKIINSGVATKLASGEETDTIPDVVETHLSALFDEWVVAMKQAMPIMLADLIERNKAEMAECEVEAEVVENV